MTDKRTKFSIEKFRQMYEKHRYIIKKILESTNAQRDLPVTEGYGCTIYKRGFRAHVFVLYFRAGK